MSLYGKFRIELNSADGMLRLEQPDPELYFRDDKVTLSALTEDCSF